MWITLTITDNGKEYPVGVNTDNLVCVRPMQNMGCLIDVKEGSPIRTKELFPDVLRKLEKAQQTVMPIAMKAEEEKVDIAELAEAAIRNHLKFPNNPLRNTMKKLIAEVQAEMNAEQATPTQDVTQLGQAKMSHRMTTAAING